VSASEHALGFFAKGYNCAQSVFAACGPAAGMNESTCLRLAAPFGGGFGRLGEVCGAVSGAMLVLGLRHGAEVTGDSDGKARHYERVREFARRFQARHGSLTCRGLLGCDISTPEGRDQARQRGVYLTQCPLYVQAAVEILDEL
jgi:C_GCAxxG_C_C family probable redox protein